MFIPVLFACVLSPQMVVECLALKAPAQKVLATEKQCEAYIGQWGQQVLSMPEARTLAHLSGLCVPVPGVKI